LERRHLGQATPPAADEPLQGDGGTSLPKTGGDAGRAGPGVPVDQGAPGPGVPRSGVPGPGVPADQGAPGPGVPRAETPGPGVPDDPGRIGPEGEAAPGWEVAAPAPPALLEGTPVLGASYAGPGVPETAAAAGSGEPENGPGVLAAAGSGEPEKAAEAGPGVDANPGPAEWGEAVPAGPGVPDDQGRIIPPAGGGAGAAGTSPEAIAFTHSAASSVDPQAWHASTPGSFAASQLTQIAPRAANGNPTARTIPGRGIQV